MLAWTIYISFLGSAGLLLREGQRARGARSSRLLAAMAGLAVAVVGIRQYTPGEMITVCVCRGFRLWESSITLPRTASA